MEMFIYADGSKLKIDLFDPVTLTIDLSDLKNEWRRSGGQVVTICTELG